MEPCDPGPERVMRQYLSQLLETGTTRSTGCLDRFVMKGMTNFPPPSSCLEGKASRCSLFEQLLCGGSRKSERLLVPDLATEWFRKQKVFLDKLTPEELDALSDGLAGKESEKSGRDQKQQVQRRCRCPGVVASQKKEAEALVGKVAACIPTTEPRAGNSNPFLIGQHSPTEEMRGKSPRRGRKHHLDGARRGSCSCLKRRAGSSCSCLFQADGQPMGSDCLAARRTEPLLPRLRRKFDLRQAPQRRLDPARFRRISPEFFRILASYEEAMSESCPLYGVSMHHWGDTKACCPCGERHPQLRQRFLGDDTVATAVVPPTYAPLESRPEEEYNYSARRNQEKEGGRGSSPIARKNPEKKSVKYAKEPSDKKGKKQCTNETCLNDECRGTKGSGKEAKEEAFSSGDERSPQKRGKQEGKAASQEVRQLDSRQSLQSSNPSEKPPTERRLWRRGDQQENRQTNPPERRRKFPNCFRRQPQSYTTACVPTNFASPPNHQCAYATALPCAQHAAHPPPAMPPDGAEIPCGHQPKGILGGFTGICKRCIEPGRHLLYNLNANYQQNRERYGQIRQNKKRSKEERPARDIFHMASQPAPCSWQKSKGNWVEEEDSSTTLTPQRCPQDCTANHVQAKSEQSLPFRTPTSDRTLAGWNATSNPDEQTCDRQLEMRQCQADCKCGLPQEAFQLPPASRCTCPPDRPAQQLLQSSEVSKTSADPGKSSSEAEYAKCGHRVRAVYLANDFHQLMRRVARKRTRAKASVPKPSPNRVLAKTKESPAVCPRTQVVQQPEAPAACPASKFQPKIPMKPRVRPKPKPKPRILSEESNTTQVATEVPKLKPLRKVRKRRVDRGPSKESLKAASSTSLGVCQAQSDIPSIGSAPQESSWNTPAKEAPRSTSAQRNREQRSPASKPPKRSPSRRSSQKRRSSCCSFCSLQGRSRRERSSKGEDTTACRKPKSRASSISEAPNMSDASCWTERSRYDYVRQKPPKKPDRRQRFQSNSSYRSCSEAYTSEYSKVWEEREDPCQCSPLKSAMKKSPVQWQADPPQRNSYPATAPSHLETGRRYYTDTQPGGGQEVGTRCSCRSLRSTSSIRALSSNTDSVRCPCAPAPSVASVEPTEEVAPAEEVPEQAGQCFCCRYQEPYLQTTSSPPSHPSPPPCAHFQSCSCSRRPKAKFFSETLRWEPQQHHHARTLLRTQRPPPPKHQQLASYPQYQEQEQQDRQWVPEYQTPCRYPEVTNQRWEDQVEDQQYHNYNYNSYPCQSNCLKGRGRDRAGAITAAAQGLRGLVKALGGTRYRPRHNPQPDYYQPTGYGEARVDNGGTALPPTWPPNEPPVSREDSPIYMGASTSAFPPRNNHSISPDFNGYPRGTNVDRDDPGNYLSVDERYTKSYLRGNMEREPYCFRMKGGGGGIIGDPSVGQRQRGGSSGFHILDSQVESPCRRTKRARQTGGASLALDEHATAPSPTPLAILLDSLRAKHAASDIQIRNTQRIGSQEPRKVATLESLPKPAESHENTTPSDDDTDADDSLDWRNRLPRAPEETMVFPSTYTGLLEEQVLGEYLPSPRCKRRS
ncbi:uncharacterized protein LOC122818598 [Drosophila biarmipes]|uniref:uncharacterized protein LOC122818598 n=1 Tax=Drosophila biarmipes TaxID=125945 RepID=UPI001CDB1E28|nr:uncharacterized protein LOC122818598 [Drosophila biarmipes]